jgi:Fe-Mn family superoxide dismutase
LEQRVRRRSAPDEEESVPKYELPELPYDYTALEPHYSAEVLELHHDKHHKAYVDGANTTFEKLGEARESGNFGTINQLEKNMAFHLSGHVLHSLLWNNMSPDGGGEPEGELAAAVKESFGSFEALRAQMSEVANSVQGSGWAVLSWEPLSSRLIVEQVYDHQGNVGQGSPPLLALDMWEHAFYLQYKNVKKDWVDAFWNVVNWPDVAARLERVRSVALF